MTAPTTPPRPDRTTLESLLARVTACGTKGDRDLDRDIHAALGLPMNERVHAGVVWNAYTTSLDAGVALVEQVLPGAVWHVMTDYGDLRRAKVGPAGRPSASVYNCEDRPLFMQADADTPALALCAALLKALVAQAGDG